MNCAARTLLLLIPLVLLGISSAFATENPEQIVTEATIIEKLDTDVDLSLRLVTSTGEEKSLGELMLKNRPVLITPVYFECPRLCNYTLNGVLKVLKALDLKLGRDFSVITYSFDSTEGPELAKAKAEVHYQELSDPADGPLGWHFVTGSEPNVRKLSESLGFKFQPDAGEYSHAAGFMVLTPSGKISRYFYGIEYQPKDLRLALVEASQGRIGTTFEKVFLFCFRYDHIQGRYTLMVWNFTRVVCLGFAGILIFSLVVLKLRGSDAERVNDAERGNTERIKAG